MSRSRVDATGTSEQNSRELSEVQRLHETLLKGLIVRESSTRDAACALEFCESGGVKGLGGVRGLNLETRK